MSRSTSLGYGHAAPAERMRSISSESQKLRLPSLHKVGSPGKELRVAAPLNI